METPTEVSLVVTVETKPTSELREVVYSSLFQIL